MYQWRKKALFCFNFDDVEVPLTKKDEDTEVVQIFYKINILLLKIVSSKFFLYILFCLLSQVQLFLYIYKINRPFVHIILVDCFVYKIILA